MPIGIFLVRRNTIGAATALATGGGSKQNSTAFAVLFCLEASPGIGPGIEVLQTFALPLGYDAL